MLHLKALPSQVQEGQRLKLLHLLRASTLEQLTDARMRRQALAQRIQEVVEDGKIAVVECGRDCDGSQYWGRRRVIEASLKAFDKLQAELEQWADGPFSLSVVRPSEDVDEGSRDLALEAFEDGHAHVLYA